MGQATASSTALGRLRRSANLGAGRQSLARARNNAPVAGIGWLGPHRPCLPFSAGSGVVRRWRVDQFDRVRAGRTPIIRARFPHQYMGCSEATTSFEGFRMCWMLDGGIDVDPRATRVLGNRRDQRVGWGGLPANIGVGDVRRTKRNSAGCRRWITASRLHLLQPTWSLYSIPIAPGRLTRPPQAGGLRSRPRPWVSTKPTKKRGMSDAGFQIGVGGASAASRRVFLCADAGLRPATKILQPGGACVLPPGPLPGAGLRRGDVVGGSRAVNPCQHYNGTRCGVRIGGLLCRRLGVKAQG